MRYLALDLGEKRIGVALTDPGGTLAFPLSVVHCGGEAQDMEAIAHLVKEHGVGVVVVGLPRSLSGSIGPEGERVWGFVEALSRRLAVPVETYDERLSTVAAERRLLETGTRRAKRKEQRDSLAAAIVLQDFLDEGRPSS